jgi:uncharacterized protein YbaR (Trm112 family)
MIPAETLALLRCPIDPSRTATLEAAEDALICSRCRTRFRISEGIPNLIAEEALLPEGCTDIRRLPCRAAPTGPNVR